MDSATLELFRQNLIAQLAAAGSYGLKIAKLKIGAKAAGFDPTDKQIADELDYLQGKQLVAPVEKVISPENAFWKITAAGRDYAAQHALA